MKIIFYLGALLGLLAEMALLFTEMPAERIIVGLLLSIFIMIFAIGKKIMEVE